MHALRISLPSLAPAPSASLAAMLPERISQTDLAFVAEPFRPSRNNDVSYLIINLVSTDDTSSTHVNDKDERVGGEEHGARAILSLAIMELERQRWYVVDV